MHRKPEASEPASLGKLLMRSRLLAFLAVSVGRGGRKIGNGGEADTMYLLKLALSVGRLSVRGADLESARIALQSAAEHVGLLKGGDGEEQGARAREASRLEIESHHEDRIGMPLPCVCRPHLR